MKILLCSVCMLLVGLQAQASKQLGVNLGFDRSVANFGVTIDSDESTGSLGGHFFIQTEKASSGVNQIVSLTPHIKVNVLKQNKINVDLNPGFGMHMVKGLGVGSSDKNVFGPTFRARFTYQISGRSSIGLDRLEVWNWFDENSGSSHSFTSAVFVTDF